MKHHQARRQEASDRQAQQQAEREQQRQHAADAIREHMPRMVDDTGQVDGFAIYAYLRLKAAGETPTPAAVRKRRADHVMFDGRTLAEWEREGNQ